MPSPIAGFESYDLVLAQLAALHAEAERPRSEQHAQEIAKQIALFQKEAKRFEKELTEQIERENEARLLAAKRGAGLLH